MCHGDDSSPPSAAGAGATGAHGEIVLEAEDGNHFAAYGARAVHGSGRGVVILPDARGLHGFYRELAVRFAEIGVDAVAIDYFGRTAGIGDRSEEFEYRPHVEKTTPEGIAADVAAAVAYLRSPGNNDAATAIFTVGFCFGGGYSWRQSADQPGLAGAIGFYGRPALAADRIDALHAPLLMLLAGADAHLPAADAESLAAAADQRGVVATVVIYPGAPHSFFDRTAQENAEASADAWTQIQTFMDQYA
jgi:carboxymethylenebutenolidase